MNAINGTQATVFLNSVQVAALAGCKAGTVQAAVIRGELLSFHTPQPGKPVHLRVPHDVATEWAAQYRLKQAQQDAARRVEAERKASKASKRETVTEQKPLAFDVALDLTPVVKEQRRTNELLEQLLRVWGAK